MRKSPRPARTSKRRAPARQKPRPRPEHSEALLEQIRALGRVQATVAEVASVLRRSEDALQSFFTEHPDAKEAYEGGRLEGLVFLRRRQFELAESNPTMAIWLGRQFLNQREKVEHTNQLQSSSQIEVVIVDPKPTIDRPPEETREQWLARRFREMGGGMQNQLTNGRAN
jgi:hypothetical protein